MDTNLARPAAPARASLCDRIRVAVEAEILSGTREPGSPIDEKALAAQFNASRTPVREALLVLAAQGLVHIAPRSGIYVRRASLAELVSTLEALAELEALVAGLAARRATPQQCDELRHAQARAHERAVSNDRSGYARANAVLHEIIYMSSGNPVLVEQVRSVRRTLAAYRQRGFDKPGRIGVSDLEHAAIVGAIRSGDCAAASEAMRSHIDLGGDALAELVMAAGSDSTGAWPGAAALAAG